MEPIYPFGNGLAAHPPLMADGAILAPPTHQSARLSKICKLIATLSAELALEILNHVVNIFATSSFSYGWIAHGAEYAHKLHRLKDMRVDQITRMATEITGFWCLLDIGEDALQ
jgi:hypothetical protein